MPIEVEVLNSKLETFLQTQPGSVEERHDDPHRPLDAFEDLADFLAAENDRNPMRQFGARHLIDGANLDAKHVTIEKQQRAQRLILRR